MTIYWAEKPGSRAITGGTEATRLDQFTLSGTVDHDAAYSLAMAYSAPFATAAGQVLYRQDVKLTHEGHDLWTVEIPYAKRNIEGMEWRLSAASSGRTQRITQSKQTVATFGPAGPPDHKGAIDVFNQEVRGADIIVPTTRFTYEVTWPAGVVSEQFIAAVCQHVGKTNSVVWHGFAIGDLLLTGINVEQGTAQKRTMRVDVEYSPALGPVAIAGIANVRKKGWELLWEYREEAVDANIAVHPTKWLYVERVYDSVDFASVLGF